MPEIRSAAVADSIRIAELHIASWRSAYRNELPASFLALLDHAQRTADWASRIASGKLHVHVAEERSALLGFCAHGWSTDDDAAPHTWEISNLHIAPDLRGRGIGTLLFDHALYSGVRAGAELMTLWVVESNDSARRFYEKHGMRLDARAFKEHVLAPGAVLHEVRYSMLLPASRPE
jgi:ribosomal protein S18 acetylase RimI-like enzyme